MVATHQVIDAKEDMGDCQLEGMPQDGSPTETEVNRWKPGAGS
jgi:hypothetical protein